MTGSVLVNVVVECEEMRCCFVEMADRIQTYNPSLSLCLSLSVCLTLSVSLSPSQRCSVRVGVIAGPSCTSSSCCSFKPQQSSDRSTLVQRHAQTHTPHTQTCIVFLSIHVRTHNGPFYFPALHSNLNLTTVA